ncbi:hypothetical protein [Agrilactobacillus composti]|nr:hypothetical protein [Agrilactobacillus composti]
MDNTFESGSSRVIYIYEQQGDDHSGKVSLTFVNNKLQAKEQRGL